MLQYITILHSLVILYGSILCLGTYFLSYITQQKVAPNYAVVKNDYNSFKK